MINDGNSNGAVKYTRNMHWVYCTIKSIGLITLKCLFLAIITILFCITTPSPPLAASDPLEKSIPLYSVTAQHYSWFFETESRPEQFQYFLNGKQITSTDAKAQKYKKMLHVRISLNPGRNTIIIKTGSKLVLNIGVFFAPSYESGLVPDEAQTVYFHTVNGEKTCRPCHRLDAKRSDVQPKDITKQICYPCHSHKFEGLEILHRPAARQWRCLICHQYKAVETDLSPDNPIKFMVNQEEGVAPICFKCHKKMQKKIGTLEYVHGPIGMGACNLCHNPHGSHFKHLLQDKISKLCINCHEFQENLEEPVVHQAIRTKGCTACHDPHGSMHRFQLLAGLNDLCYKCHPKIFKQRNDHPLHNHPVFIPATSGNKDSKLTCVNCHNPHSSKFAHLLPVADTMMLCAKCHNVPQ